MDNKNVNFGDYLRSEMGKRHLDVTETAKLIGVTRATIYNIFNGERNAGIKFCYRVANAFGIPPEEVLRAAGLLPPLPDMDISKVVEIARQLNQENLDYLVEVGYWRLQEQRIKYTTPKAPE